MRGKLPHVEWREKRSASHVSHAREPRSIQKNLVQLSGVDININKYVLNHNVKALLLNYYESVMIEANLLRSHNSQKYRTVR